MARVLSAPMRCAQPPEVPKLNVQSSDGTHRAAADHPSRGMRGMELASSVPDLMLATLGGERREQGPWQARPEERDQGSGEGSGWEAAQCRWRPDRQADGAA